MAAGGHPHGRAAQAIEQVIQTATGVLTARYGPREAVTILASQVPQARAGAATLVASDPAKAAAYAELLASIVGELGAEREESAQARELREVVAELDRVIGALTPSPREPMRDERRSET